MAVILGLNKQTTILPFDMPWTIIHDEQLDFIVVTNEGEFTFAGLQEQTIQALALSKTTGSSRFLIDISRSVLKMSFLELFSQPVVYDRALDRARSKAGVIIPTTGHRMEKAFFYETVCRNRGWNVRVFEDREKAVAWLNEPVLDDNGLKPLF